MGWSEEMRRVAYANPITTSEEANTARYFRRIDDRLAAGLTLNK